MNNKASSSDGIIGLEKLKKGIFGEGIGSHSRPCLPQILKRVNHNWSDWRVLGLIFEGSHIQVEVWETLWLVRGREDLEAFLGLDVQDWDWCTVFQPDINSELIFCDMKLDSKIVEIPWRIFDSGYFLIGSIVQHCLIHRIDQNDILVFFVLN